eukprot:jgi/Chlat1/6886/Chrsp51S06554
MMALRRFLSHGSSDSSRRHSQRDTWQSTHEQQQQAPGPPQQQAPAAHTHGITTSGISARSMTMDELLEMPFEQLVRQTMRERRLLPLESHFEQLRLSPRHDLFHVAHYALPDSARNRLINRRLANFLAHGMANYEEPVMTYEEMLALDDTIVKRGTSKHDLEKLRKLRATHKHTTTECQVCKEFFASGESLLQLPCEHCYHAACIRKWLEANRTCPICRYEFP